MREVVRELLRLRYGAGRVGHTGGHILELVARSGSETTIAELVAGTGRRRDNVRRTLRKLEARHLVECSGENVRLVADFAVALDRELERVEASEPPESPTPTPEPVPLREPMLTNAKDPEQFSALVSLARQKIAEHRRKHKPRIHAERVEKLPPEDASVLEAIEAFEDKHGPGSFKWNQSGAKELFYSDPGGHWPLPDQLQRIREHVEAAGATAA